MNAVLTGAARSAVALVLATLAVCVRPVQSQEPDCPEGVIRHIFIDNHSIFNVAEMEPDTPFRDCTVSLTSFTGGPLRLHREQAAFWHWRLFGPSAPGRIGTDSAVVSFHRRGRHLPGLPSATTPFTSSSIHRTSGRSGWTHAPLSRTDSALHTWELPSKNLLGTGALFGFFCVRRRSGAIWVRSCACQDWVEHVLMRGLAGGERGTGSFFEESLAYPFVGEVGRVAFVESFSLPGGPVSLCPPLFRLPTTSVAPSRPSACLSKPVVFR